MALKVPNVGELLILDALVTAKLNGAKLRLFKNNYTPIDTTVIGDLTEADFSGYAEITLNTWTAAFTNADGKGEVDEINRTFTRAAGATSNDIYGIYVVDSLGNLIYAERNPAGVVTMGTVGQTYSYLPKFTGQSEF